MPILAGALLISAAFPLYSLEVALQISSGRELSAAIEATDKEAFDVTLGICLEEFKDMIRSSASESTGAPDLYNFEKTTTFKDVASFIQDHLFMNSRAQNSDSSRGYGTLRTRWNLTSTSTQGLKELIERYKKSFIFFVERARAHGRLERGIWLTTCFFPLIILLIATIRPLAARSISLLWLQWTDADGIPLFVLGGVYTVWLIIYFTLKTQGFLQKATAITHATDEAHESLVDMSESFKKYATGRINNKEKTARVLF